MHEGKAATLQLLSSLKSNPLGGYDVILIRKKTKKNQSDSYCVEINYNAILETDNFSLFTGVAFFTLT